MTRVFRKYVALSLLVACAATSANADWLRFRGPNGSGVSEEANATPVEWSPETVKWKTALPGPGSSCPIVVGDKVFVTCWSGYGMDRTSRDPGDQADLRRHLICVDKNTGKEVWKKTIDPVLPEDSYGGMFAEHGYASHTPVSDGEHVFVFFGKTGVLGFDMEGKELWQTSVGTESGARNWGSSSSPVLFEDLVIVPATAESESLVALNKETGKEVWKAPAAGFNSTWGSPILVKSDDKTDVVLAIPGEIWGLNAETGKLSWFSEVFNGGSMCSSPVVDSKGVVYAMESGPRGGGAVAIRAGGSKDITDTNTVWSGNQSNRISTPILFENRLYMISNNTVTCLNAADSKQIFRSRLKSSGGAAASNGGGGGGRRGGRGGRGGQDYGSPVLADGKIYYTSRAGETFVIKAGTKFEQLASNRVTADAEDFSATPAISDGKLFIRSSKNLYCVAKD